MSITSSLFGRDLVEWACWGCETVSHCWVLWHCLLTACAERGTVWSIFSDWMGISHAPVRIIFPLVIRNCLLPACRHKMFPISSFFGNKKTPTNQKPKQQKKKSTNYFLDYILEETFIFTNMQESGHTETNRVFLHILFWVRFLLSDTVPYIFMAIKINKMIYWLDWFREGILVWHHQQE